MRLCAQERGGSRNCWTQLALYATLRSVDTEDFARAARPAGLLPFDAQRVTITKREHIALVMQAKQWKSLHERALRRLEWAERRHRFELAQAQERETRVKAQLDLALAQVRGLRSGYLTTERDARLVAMQGFGVPE